jgi:hypothetical protein
MSKVTYKVKNKMEVMSEFGRVKVTSPFHKSSGVGLHNPYKNKVKPFGGWGKKRVSFVSEVKVKVDIEENSAIYSIYAAVDKFANELWKGEEQMRKLISDMIVSSSKQNHRFQNRTGRLQSGIRSKSSKIMSEIAASTVDYAPFVINKTKDDFISESITRNETKIKYIIENHLKKNTQVAEIELTKAIKENYNKVIKNQFSKIK